MTRATEAKQQAKPKPGVKPVQGFLIRRHTSPPRRRAAIGEHQNGLAKRTGNL